MSDRERYLVVWIDGEGKEQEVKFATRTDADNMARFLTRRGLNPEIRTY